MSLVRAAEVTDPVGCPELSVRCLIFALVAVGFIGLVLDAWAWRRQRRRFGYYVVVALVIGALLGLGCYLLLDSGQRSFVFADVPEAAVCVRPEPDHSRAAVGNFFFGSAFFLVFQLYLDSDIGRYLRWALYAAAALGWATNVGSADASLRDFLLACQGACLVDAVLRGLRWWKERRPTARPVPPADPVLDVGASAQVGPGAWAIFRIMLGLSLIRGSCRYARPTTRR